MSNLYFIFTVIGVWSLGVILLGYIEKIDQKKCKHERYKFDHSFELYDLNLIKISTSVYKCVKCGKIKKDEIVK